MGEIECRIRANGPTPGKNPKKLGARPSVNCSRLPCCRNRPPVNWLRSMKGPALVLLTMPMPGCSLQVPLNTWGRLMPVDQSTRVSNERAYTTVCSTEESIGSGTTSCRGCEVRLSVIETELVQFQRPSRSGVPMEIVLARLSNVVPTVSTPPPARGSNRGVPTLWNVWVLVKLNDGDQVAHEARSIGAGVIDTRGRFCCTRLFDRFCERFPPRLSVPQEKRLSKFAWELS